VHSAQCTMMCAAVPCTRARDGTARHVAGEGRAAAVVAVAVSAFCRQLEGKAN
jgi:hypothetical protein